MQDSRCVLHDVSCGTCTGLTCCLVIGLVGVVVLKEVVSCTVFFISVPVAVLSVIAVECVVVLKEVVGCAIFCISVLVVLCVLV